MYRSRRGSSTTEKAKFWNEKRKKSKWIREI